MTCPRCGELVNPGHKVCPDCEYDETQEELGKLEQEHSDLAMLVTQLVAALHKNGTNPLLADRAMDYLKRHNLLGSPLREA